MKKPRHVSWRGSHFRYDATADMRKAGIFSESLRGLQEVEAFIRADELNAEWDEIRNNPVNPTKVNGDFNWLIAEYQRDKSWYGSLAPKTKVEIDACLAIVSEFIGTARVKHINRQSCRAIYNKIRVDGSAHKAQKVRKWFVRLLNYAVEIGVIDFNPGVKLQMERQPGRNQTYSPDEIDCLVDAAKQGGKADSGNNIPARPSIALAVMIAYDTSLPRQDILDLKWSQFDGEGLTVRLKKKRGPDEDLWLPLSHQTLDLLDTGNVHPLPGTNIVISEETGKSYGAEAFSRIFRKFRDRAGIKGSTFHDLRRTALTELGNTGATNAQIVKFSGHDIASKALKDYIQPDKEITREAAKRRWDKIN